jgi:hypothetical protein
MQHKQELGITWFEQLKLQATLFYCDALTLDESDYMYIHNMNIALYVHEELTSYAAWKAV